MKTAIVIGLGSDLASDMAKRLGKDGWFISGSTKGTCDLADVDQIHKTTMLLSRPWDLLIIAPGTLHPVSEFLNTYFEDWERSVRINALGPLRMLRALLPSANKGATAVLFSGTNPLRRNPRYSAYSSAKAMLVRAAEEIDSEVEQKICVMAPGFVNTKIHKAHEVNRTDSTSPEAIYKCLLYMIERPKKEVGGKVIHVPSWARIAIEFA
jgi:NAD(P)-dependent dehydrogenase (short-subunit alcohol dehydrogenase family)